MARGKTKSAVIVARGRFRLDTTCRCGSARFIACFPGDEEQPENNPIVWCKACWPWHRPGHPRKPATSVNA
jgi:hypothetical protein